MKERKLKITYKIQDNGELEEKMEKELVKILTKFGWLWEGQMEISWGYTMNAKVREISFYKNLK